MKQVTVTITTDKPVSVRIMPCKDLFDELLDIAEIEEDRDEVVKKTNA